jgi:hypothetical protein
LLHAHLVYFADVLMDVETDLQLDLLDVGLAPEQVHGVFDQGLDILGAVGWLEVVLF